MKKVALPFAVCLLLLGACANRTHDGGDGNKGENYIVRTDVCRMSYVNPAGDFKTSALDIPFGTHVGAPTIKIGSVEYSHAQAQKLGDAAQKAEQTRAAFCIATDPATFNQLSQKDKGDVVKLGLAAQMNVAMFESSVLSATTPEDGLKAAQGLTSASTAVQSKVAAIVPAAAPGAVGTPVPPPVQQSAGKQTSATYPDSLPLADAFKRLSDKMDVLSQKLTRADATDEIRVLGFDPKGLSLPATEREQLFTRFQKALDKIPKSQRPVVFIVGYASKSGAYLKNIGLGLERAKTVTSFLEAQKFSRGYERHVMTGGVDDSAYGGRVDVFVTGV